MSLNFKQYKTFVRGSATTPATTKQQSTPSISIDSAGLITASVAATSVSVTPTVSAGYVTAGTAGTVTMSASSNTKQLTTKAATTITPSSSSQTAVASGVYTTGAITVAGDANLLAKNIKSGVTIFGVTGTYDGFDPPTAVGQTYVFDGKTWIVSHQDGNNWYLTLKDIPSLTQFHASSTAYAGSTLASVAASFQANMSIEALSHCVDVTTGGVTAKVFVATKDQMNGGFSYFNSNKRRIAQYGGGNYWYWTSSAYSAESVWYVNDGGGLNDACYPYYTGGFRPSVCITG